MATLHAQNDAWHIVADHIDPANYYGITVANGMIGLVSSPEPMRVKDVVLNGAYDNYGRGRVSNILKGFNFVNMNLDVDGRRIGRKDISDYKQTLDMRQAQLTTTFNVGDQVSVSHRVMALRHLPFCALSLVEITAKKRRHHHACIRHRSAGYSAGCAQLLLRNRPTARAHTAAHLRRQKPERQIYRGGFVEFCF